MPALEQLARDLRFGVRTLWKSRGFTSIAALSLAMGIGANTALFSLVDTLLLLRLPVNEPDRLVTVRRVATANLTRPMSEPFTDVIQDLWQLGHVTASYVALAAAGAILLATGIIEDNPVAIVVAALFLPFLAQSLAVSFGLWNRDRRLIVQGLRALLISTVLAVGAGAVVACIEGGPILFTGFKGPLSSFAISAVIGVTAGLSVADDTGRRYLIGVAAAVQLAIFPVWLGAAFVIGMPSHDVFYPRLLSFVVNLISIAVCAVVAYAALPLGGGAGWKAPRSGRAGG